MVAKSLRLGFSCLCFLMLAGCGSQLSAPISSLTSTPVATKTTGPLEISPQPQPTQVALLLPLSGGLANAGRAIQDGFSAGYAGSTVHPTVKVYDTASGDITTIYQQAVHDGANYVVGPLDKTKVETLSRSGDITVNTIALNSVTGDRIVPNFYEFGLSPNAEAVQVADKAANAGYHNAIMITPSGSWGEDIANSLSTEWQAKGGKIVDSLSVSSDSDLQAKIQNLSQNADVIFLIARPSLAREIKPLLNSNTPVYGTSLVYTGLLDSARDKNLNGLVFCDEPLVVGSSPQWSAIRQNITLAEPVFVQQYIRLYGLGYDAALLTQNLSAINSTISGATGVLSLNSNQHIVRKLSWAVFQRGLPTQIS